MSNELNAMSYFPKELNMQIYGKLSLLDLGRCCRVCTLWNKTLSSDDELWLKALDCHQFKLLKNVKSTVFSHKLESFNDILGDIQTSINEILSQNKTGQYLCFFPNNSLCHIEVKISWDEKDTSEQVYFFKYFRCYVNQIAGDTEVFNNVKYTYRLEFNDSSNHVVRISKIDICLPESYKNYLQEINNIARCNRISSA